MTTPQFRFTLGDNKVISDPEGWDEIVLNLDRHETYHSLVEIIDIPLSFYGRTGSNDGGYHYLKEARANGLDSRVSIMIEISLDRGTTYELFYTGLLDLTTMVEIEHEKKIQCSLMQTDLWSKFINRKATPVDIQAATTLDGTAISTLTPLTIAMSGQSVRQLYQGEHDDNISYAIVGNFYGIIDFGRQVVNEIKDKFNYPRTYSADRPFELFAMKYAGDYEFTSEIFATDGAINQVTDLDVYFQINDETPIAFSVTDLGTNGVDGRTLFEYSDTHTLEKGDFIRIYFRNSNGGTNTFEWTSSYPSFLNVTADTTYPDTEAEGFPIHDVAHSIVNRIVSQENSFYSEYFGGTTETARSYGADGDGLDHVLAKGLQVRGYSLTDKPFSLSFDEWWDGVNPIFNLGAGYDRIGSTDVIRVEPKSFFYDDSAQSAVLEDVNDIKISFDSAFINTSIQIGYLKWDIESESGIDDPQTVHSYSTRYQTAGSKESKDVKLLSSFYAASLGIEQTRRNGEDLSKDWKLDEDVLIIQADIGADTAAPVLYEAPDFTISELLNSETRYNVRLTPASNLYRWKPYLNIGLNGYHVYSSDFYKFQRGEGNTDMTFNEPGGPNGTPPNYVQENGDILIGTDALFKNVLFNFTHALKWAQYKQIRGDRTRSITVRYYGNDGNHYQAIGFIKKLSYKINEGKADFEFWLKTLTEI